MSERFVDVATNERHSNAEVNVGVTRGDGRALTQESKARSGKGESVRIAIVADAQQRDCVVLFADSAHDVGEFTSVATSANHHDLDESSILVADVDRRGG